MWTVWPLTLTFNLAVLVLTVNWIADLTLLLPDGTFATVFDIFYQHQYLFL